MHRGRTLRRKKRRKTTENTNCKPFVSVKISIKARNKGALTYKQPIFKKILSTDIVVTSSPPPAPSVTPASGFENMPPNFHSP